MVPLKYNRKKSGAWRQRPKLKLTRRNQNLKALKKKSLCNLIVTQKFNPVREIEKNYLKSMNSSFKICRYDHPGND